MKKGILISVAVVSLLVYVSISSAVPVADDPAVRMPGTQPEQGVNLEGPGRCLNCHAGYNQAVEPGYNWMGSMMAQAARDPLFWACMTVAAQDSMWAIGSPDAADLCERCHFPLGWLGGRSDPPNASQMTGDDFDGISCDFCHNMWNPFYEDTHSGEREGNDWLNYWDEASTLSQSMANDTYNEDDLLADGIVLFSGGNFFGGDNRPLFATYSENASGQYFISNGSQKRASFADANAKHQFLYSRYHKSRYMCGTCHDVSNPVLANLETPLPDQSGGTALTTEQYSASRYFHVERTFSEFSLSAYGQQGGAPTNIEFRAQGAPEIANAAKCQDCHMRDVVGPGCNKNGTPIRPWESAEHPNSGLPLHDMTGGNAWVTEILASLDPNGPVYDPVNVQILDKGPAVLTLDLNAGQSPKTHGAELMAGADRARQQLLLAATIKNLSYDSATGALSFQVQNNSGHKLISGFPEGRRMFLNVKAYSGSDIVYEINPYDDSAGTLKGMPGAAALGANEVFSDALVYEMHPKSDFTGENESFHFVLGTSRYKDNRIPPKGFNISGAAARLAEPVWHGVSDPTYFTSAEYAGGYDEVNLNIPAGADYVEVALYYQGVSREYVKFLSDEINGSGTTLPANAYVIQTDPFFSGLKEWGNTIWNLWWHNHGLDGSGKQVPGIVPFEMAQATAGSPPAPPTPECSTPSAISAFTATGNRRRVDLSWSAVSGVTGGYRLYYYQIGKLQLLVSVDANTTSYRDNHLQRATEYCYEATAWNDCDGDGAFDPAIDNESTPTSVVCATTK